MRKKLSFDKKKAMIFFSKKVGCLSLHPHNMSTKSIIIYDDAIRLLFIIGAYVS